MQFERKKIFPKITLKKKYIFSSKYLPYYKNFLRKIAFPYWVPLTKNSSISHRSSRGSLVVERRRFTAATTTGRIRIDNWTVESRESRCEWPMSRCIAMASEYNGTISWDQCVRWACHSVIQRAYGEIMGAVGFCAICLTYVTRPTRRLQFRAINYFA